MHRSETRTLALAAGTLLLAGCAQPVHVRPMHGAHRADGAQAAPAYPSAMVFGSTDPGYRAFGRRDGSLSYRPAAPIVNAGAWPTEARRSLRDARRVRLPRSADQILIIPDYATPRRSWRRY